MTCGEVEVELHVFISELDGRALPASPLPPQENITLY
jgi:hypothetical protein